MLIQCKLTSKNQLEFVVCEDRRCACRRRTISSRPMKHRRVRKSHNTTTVGYRLRQF